MRIALIGGHGKVALLLEPLLAAAGHQVDAVIRNPAHEADVAATGAHPVVLSVEDADASQLADLVRGHDAVIWSAGAGGGNPGRTYAVDRDAAIRTIDAAVEAGVRRFVMVSYFGAGRPDRPHGVDPDNSFFAYAEAKAAADEHLRGSGLDWTIVAPSGLTLDAPTGRIEVNTGSTAGGTVTRADVAAVVAAVLSRDDLAGATIEFNSGDVPVSEALDSVAH